MSTNISSVYLVVVTFATVFTMGFSVQAGNGEQPPAPAKAEIDALPKAGKGHEMVRPYQQPTTEPVQVMPEQRGNSSRSSVPTPLSREIVPPSYRYGSPGYQPDGWGGRGYDFGYPGYRDGGGGGYPHHRSFGNSRRIR